MIDKVKKITNIFLSILGFVGIVALILFLVFIENPVRYFFYALCITVFINFKSFRYLRIDFKKFSTSFLMVISCVYLPLITLLSVSPFLTIQEFKATHLTWKPIQPKTIQSSSFWEPGHKRRGNTYTTIYYEYQSDGKLYKKSEPEALKKYYVVWDTRKKEVLVNEFSKSVTEKIKNKDYIILKNPSHPQETQLFLSTDYFYFQGSLFYNMITSVVALIFVVLGLFFIIIVFSKKSNSN